MTPCLPIPPYAQAVLQRLEQFGYEAYVVGGCVRDSLMGHEPKDWDICTNATPQQVLSVFRRFHVIKTGLKHGTVTVMSGHEPVEVTTFRLDGAYSDNRHPDAVSFVSRVEEDLARRDFTINAMAYNPRRGLVDAFGGQQDLEARLIRCVGEPDARFHEDGLRIMRALRFAARYDFGIERETAFAMRRNRHLLGNISAERLYKELKGMLVGKGAAQMALAFPEVLAVIMPEVEPCLGFGQHSPHHLYDVWTHTAYAIQAAPQDDVLRLTMLLHDIAKPACFSLDETGKGHFNGHPQKSAEMAHAILSRFKSDNATLEAVTCLVREHDAPFPVSRAGMRCLIGRLGVERVRQLFVVKRADLAAQSDFGKERKEEVLRDAALLMDDVLEAAPAFTVHDLAINGRDLMQLGMPAGPGLGRMLSRLLQEVQEETLANDRDTLLERAGQLNCADASRDGGVRV